MTANPNRSVEPRSNTNNSLNSRDDSIPSTIDPPSLAPTRYGGLCLPVPTSSGVYYDNTSSTTSVTSNGTINPTTVTSKLSESLTLGTTSPRQSNGSLTYLPSPVVASSSPGQSPLTPMGTDTDFTYPLSSYNINGGANGPTTPGRSQQQRLVSSSPVTSIGSPPAQSLAQQVTVLEPSVRMAFSANAQTRQILQRNSSRLAELANDIKQLVKYGIACDEFMAWLQDFRAYNQENEEPMMKCAEAVYRSAPEFGPWTGFKILETINENCHLISSPQNQAQIRAWYRDIQIQQDLIPQSPASTSSSLANIPASPLVATINSSSPSTSQPQFSLPSLPVSTDGLTNSDYTTNNTVPVLLLQGQGQRHQQAQQQTQQHRPLQPLQPQQRPLHPHQPQQRPLHPHQPQQRPLHPQQQQQQRLQQQRSPSQQQRLPSQLHQQARQPPYQNQQQRPSSRSNQQTYQPTIQSYQQKQQGYVYQQQQYQQLTPLQQQQMQMLRPQQNFHSFQGNQMWAQYAYPQQSIPQQMIVPPIVRQQVIAQQVIPQQGAQSIQQLVQSVTMTQSVHASPKYSLYSYQVRHALAPFRLEHSTTKTVITFNINNEEYDRLSLSPIDHMDDSKTQTFVKYYLHAWKGKTSEFKLDWPQSVSFLINNVDPVIIKKQKHPGDPARFIGKDQPNEINHLLVKGANVLTVKQDQCACNYFFAIGVFYCQTETSIAKEISTTTLDMAFGEGLINKLLGHNDNKHTDDADDDIEVIQESVKLNLKCPISMSMIKMPVKGAECKHPDCFDLHSYLIMNPNALTSWKCPFCNFYTPPNSLRHDSFFQHIQDSAPKNAYEITISGSSNNWRVTKADSIDDIEDDDDNDMADSKDIKPVHLPNSNTTIQAAIEPDNVISLLSDNEEEEDELVGTSNEQQESEGDKERMNTKRGNKHNDDSDSEGDDLGTDNRHKRHCVDGSLPPTSTSNMNITIDHSLVTEDTPSQWVTHLQNLRQQYP